MAVYEFPSLFFPQMPVGNGLLTATSLTAITTTDWCAAILQAPKSGTIKKLGIHVMTVTNPGSVNVMMTSIDASGAPSAVYETVETAITAAGMMIGTLATGRSVTKGELFGLYVQGRNNGTSITVGASTRMLQNFPYSYNYGTKSNRAPYAYVEYSDGTCAYMPSVLPIDSTNTVSLQVAGAVRMGGMKFKVPVKSRVVGCHLGGDMDGDFAFKLLDASDTELASLTWDKDYRGSTAETAYYALFNTPAWIEADTWYRLVAAATTATATKPRYFTVPVAAAMDMLEGGSNIIFTTYDGAAWTDDSLSRCVCGVIIDAIDVEGGGGATSFAF